MNKRMILFIIVLSLYLFFFIPVFEWDIKIKALITLVLIQILWIGRVFPLAYGSILLIVILSFHFFSYEETMSYFGSGLVWLLFSIFIISSAFVDTGLANRISLQMLRMSRGSGSRLIFISFILLFALSLFMPSNIGKGSLVASIIDGIVKNIKKVQQVPNLSKSLFIGIAYLTAISGAVVATGASSTIYAYGMLSEMTSQLNYLLWVVYIGPPIILFVVLLWGTFLVMFPPENVDRTIIIKLLDEKIETLGKIKPSEKRMIGIIGLTLFLWITQSVHGYSIPLIGMFGASLTMLPVIGVWDWEKAKENINWDMMLFFAATLMLSKMLLHTSTVDWLATLIIGNVSTYSFYVVFFVFVLSAALLRVIFVNVLGFLTIMIPLAMSIGENMTGFPPEIISMAVFLMGVPGFFLITQSPVHLISHSYGYFNEKELVKVGMVSIVFWLLIVFASVFFYWNFLI